jgi:hypothetical protein
MAAFPEVEAAFGDVSTLKAKSAFCYKANKIVEAC